VTRDTIAAGVRECVAKAIDAPLDAIRLEDRIIMDLDADSLDLLDLIFQLEQRFKISISPRGIERRAREKLGEIPFETDGVYTPEGLEELRDALPEIPPEELSEGLTVAGLPRLFRVQTFVNLVERLLEEKNG